jgi:hypothetical protein
MWDKNNQIIKLHSQFPEKHRRFTVRVTQFLIQFLRLKVIVTHFEIEFAAAFFFGVVFNFPKQKLANALFPERWSHNKIVNINQKFCLPG